MRDARKESQQAEMAQLRTSFNLPPNSWDDYKPESELQALRAFYAAVKEEYYVGTHWTDFQNVLEHVSDHLDTLESQLKELDNS